MGVPSSKEINKKREIPVDEVGLYAASPHFFFCQTECFCQQIFRLDRNMSLAKKYRRLTKKEIPGFTLQSLTQKKNINVEYQSDIFHNTASLVLCPSTSHHFLFIHRPASIYQINFTEKLLLCGVLKMYFESSI